MKEQIIETYCFCDARYIICEMRQKNLFTKI